MAHALADGDDGDPAADPVAAAVAEDIEKANRPFKRSGRKVGRNEPCPCGSGKKYKQCHGLVS
jgi:preprotein translocase subunit SecA